MLGGLPWFAWIAIVAILVCAFVEMLGPWIAENKMEPTPWHPHHIAERYSLLTIITLGEGVVGTVTVLGALIEVQGWSTDTVLLGTSAMTATFAMWWVYFIVPVGDALHEHRHKRFWWGYGHILIFMAAAGFGAGLHVAALYIEHESHVAGGAVVAAHLAGRQVGGFGEADRGREVAGAGPVTGVGKQD